MPPLLLLMLLAAADAPGKAPPPRLQVEAPKTPGEPADPDEDDLPGLAKVRRIYVDDLSGGESAVQIRDMIITSLHSSKLFIITEQEARADAVLKGSGSDEVFTDVFSSSEGINAHTQVGDSNDNTTTRYGGGARKNHSAGMGIGESDSRHTEERKHEAMATVRLVSKDGDVIWSTTQESKGAKFLGASADVADKIAKRLAADCRRAKEEAKPRVELPRDSTAH